MMNIAARYLRPSASVDGDTTKQEVSEIPHELQERVRGHKVVAYPTTPSRGRTTQAPDSSSPRPRSLSESRKATTRTKSIVKDVYDRMGISYDPNSGADLSSKTRSGRSRQLEDNTSERSRPRSLSRGRIASIWPPQSPQNNLDNSWSFSPKHSSSSSSQPMSPTKKAMNATTAMAFSKNKHSNHHKPTPPAFASPAYCKDMLTLLPHTSKNNNDDTAVGSISPKSTSSSTLKTEGCSETDVDVSVSDAAPQRLLSVKERIHSLGAKPTSGLSKNATTQQPKIHRNISARHIDPQYAAKLASGVGLAPKVDIYGKATSSTTANTNTMSATLSEEKKDDDMYAPAEVTERSTGGAIAKLEALRHSTAASHLVSHKATAAKRQTSVSSAFRRTGPTALDEHNPQQVPSLALSASSSDFDVLVQRPVDPYHPHHYETNDDMDRLIDERVQAHVAVIEAKMESQLGRFMEQMNRKMELLQTEIHELQAAAKIAASRSRP